MSSAHAADLRPARPAVGMLAMFGAAALAVGLARAVTTTYLPVLLEAINDAPGLIGAVMLVNPLAGFFAPLVVGVWSDRRGGRTARVPFLIGGALLAAGGLAAIAVGTGSSYLVLALAGLATYLGLSGALTAHRATIAARFDEEARPAATSAQELQRSAGGLLGVVVGGVLIAASPRLLFVAAAAAVLVLAVPTVRVLIRRDPATDAAGDRDHDRRPSARDLLAVVRRPGAREVVLAQGLWVLAYVALPTFFVLYARDVLDLQTPESSFVLGGVGLLAGAGMLTAGRLSPRLVQPALLAGAVLLGAGLTLAAAFDDVGAVLLPFAVAAFGFGLVNTLGFPYFSRFVERDAAGRFSGVYFAVRAVAAAVALPLAGLMVQLTGSYRGVLLQGAAAFLALVPLTRAAREDREQRR